METEWCKHTLEYRTVVLHIFELCENFTGFPFIHPKVCNAELNTFIRVDQLHTLGEVINAFN